MAVTNLQSVEKQQKKLQEFLKTVESYPEKIMKEEAEKILLEAKAESPVDTGRLRSSIKIKVFKYKKGTSLQVSAVARDPDSNYDYAPIQHEEESFRHLVGKAHFVIDPLKRGITRIIRRVNKELKRKL